MDSSRQGYSSNLKSNSQQQFNMAQSMRAQQKDKGAYYQYIIVEILDVQLLLLILLQFEIEQKQLFEAIKYKHQQQQVYCVYVYLYLSSDMYQKIYQKVKSYGLNLLIKKFSVKNANVVNISDLCLKIFFQENKYSIIKIMEPLPKKQFQDSIKTIYSQRLQIKRITKDYLLLINKTYKDIHYRIRCKNELMIIRLTIILSFQEFLSFYQQKEIILEEEREINVKVQNQANGTVKVNLLFQVYEQAKEFVVNNFVKLISKKNKIKKNSQEYVNQHFNSKISQPLKKQFLQIISKGFQPLQELKNKLSKNNFTKNQVPYNIKEIVLLSFMKSKLLSNGRNYKYQDNLSSEIISLEQLGNEIDQLYSSQWQDIFDLVRLYFSKNIIEIRQHIQQIHYHRLNYLKCLGCIQFCYYNYTNLAKSQNCNVVPLNIFQLSFLQNQYKYQIIQSICSMLNNKGGILFFDCFREWIGIITKGSRLTETNKQLIEYKLNEYMELIEPKPKVSLVKLAFVPVALYILDQNAGRKKLQAQLGQKMQYKLSYIEGQYITRIQVMPSYQPIVFSYKGDQPEDLNDIQYEKRHIAVGNKKPYNKYLNKHTCNKPNQGLTVQK